MRKGAKNSPLVKRFCGGGGGTIYIGCWQDFNGVEWYGHHTYYNSQWSPRYQNFWWSSSHPQC